MTSLISKCGNICNICPLYKENLLTQEDRQRTAEGCGKYINWNPDPEKLKLCSGCQSKEGFIYIPKCKVRICAIHNDVENCAYCSAFPCEDSFTFPTREEKEKQLGHKVPDEDYRSFLAPWESTIVLKKLRKKFKEEDIKQMQPVDLKFISSNFPEVLKSLPEDKYAFYKSLHKTIISIIPMENISVARTNTIKNMRTISLSLLFTFGLHGQLNTEYDVPQLELHQKDYFSEVKGKFLYNINYMEKLFSILQKKGINISIDSKRVLSKTGFLAKKGDWVLRMSFDKQLAGNKGLKFLKEYITLLDKEKGKNSFKTFARADLKVLSLLSEI